MRPVIGVMPLWDGEKESVWMLPGYTDGIRSAGGIPVIFPLTADREELGRLTDLCDGFLFTGGHDVSPELYGETPSAAMGETCPLRDAMETTVLEKALASGKAVLGICRGLQFINAALGGTLYQDLPSQRPSGTEHHQSPPYDRPVHRVTLSPGSPLRALAGVGMIPVNSYHHQAVKRLSPELRPMAVSEDGLVEAAYMPGAPFVWAVQWHPEFSLKSDGLSLKIFRAFAQAAALRSTDAADSE